jgi:hypothetical protein
VLLNINTAANMWLSKAGEAEEDEVGTPFSVVSQRNKASPKDSVSVIPAARPIKPGAR